MPHTGLELMEKSATIEVVTFIGILSKDRQVIKKIRKPYKRQVSSNFPAKNRIYFCQKTSEKAPKNLLRSLSTKNGGPSRSQLAPTHIEKAAAAEETTRSGVKLGRDARSFLS